MFGISLTQIEVYLHVIEVISTIGTLQGSGTKHDGLVAIRGAFDQTFGKTDYKFNGILTGAVVFELPPPAPERCFLNRDIYRINIKRDHLSVMQMSTHDYRDRCANLHSVSIRTKILA